MTGILHLPADGSCANLHSGVVGATGYGKTFFVKSLLQNPDSYAPLTVIVDPAGAYKNLDGVTHIDAEGMGEGFDFESHRGHLPVVLDFPLTADSIKRFDAICRDILRIGSCSLVVEEAADFAKSEELDRLLYRGRNSGIAVCLVSQRPYQLSPVARSNVHTWALFCFLSERDCKWVADTFGYDMAKRVKALRQPELIHEDGEDVLLLDYHIVSSQGVENEC